MSVTEKLQDSRQKRLLALDGGGIRGMIPIEVLAQMESLLRQQLGRGDDFVLADYFDYVAGTSTGAIIAACLSLGMRVSQIRSFYEENGKAMFEAASLLRRLRYKYDDEKLAAKLQEVFGKETDEKTGTQRDLTLGSGKLRTLLMMVMRNATTDSPWPVSNNPRSRYNERSLPDCNLDLPLWQLVRASTAAPTYFPPELVKIGEREFLFVDGGVTSYNNPAFLLFLMSTLGPYKLAWPAGQDKMLLVSVGTGTAPDVRVNLQASSMNLLFNASTIPSALMFASLNEQDMLCRSFGRCKVGGVLDSELGDMRGSFTSPVEPRLFTYLRYNAELTREGLDKLGLPDVKPEHVQQMDSIQYIPELQNVGRAVARSVQREHFEGFP